MNWLWQHFLDQPERLVLFITILAYWWQELLIFGIPIGVIAWIIW